MTMPANVVLRLFDTTSTFMPFFAPNSLTGDQSASRKVEATE